MSVLQELIKEINNTVHETPSTKKPVTGMKHIVFSGKSHRCIHLNDNSLCDIFNKRCIDVLLKDCYEHFERG